ncbi:hypothetical protein [Pseudarthrobacter sp. J75]|uniref:hypothetical protein n=1 Tax=Pseudarthrobacter sp. J75 TaxID=3116486 RepID=UPI002E817D64|nr:hypothetical protein [Pseudarthrobacter sp. J75]
MLPKIEFGHFYKFIASLGLVMMGLAVALPWLIFQQMAPLVIKESDLVQYTTLAQQTISERQQNLQWWAENQLGLSIFTFLSGVAVTLYGLQEWKERQRVTDDKEKEELRSLIAAAPASDREVSDRLHSEVEAAMAENPEDNKTESDEAPSNRASTEAPQRNQAAEDVAASAPQTAEARRNETRLKIEKYEGRLGEILATTLAPTHSVTRNARLSVATEYSGTIHDVVAVPRGKTLPAYVFDVKFSSRLFPGRITESAVRMAADIADLPAEEHDRVFGCLVFVLSSEDDRRYLTPFRAGLEVDRIRKVFKKPVGIVILTESEFELLSYDDLSLRVLGALGRE